MTKGSRLYRCVFRITGSAETPAVTRYVESDHMVNQAELSAMFGLERSELEKAAKARPNDGGVAAKLRESTAILSALRFSMPEVRRLGRPR